jgi:hypothetical protein
MWYKSSPVTGQERSRGFQEVKVKQSRYRPVETQRVPESYGKAVPLQARRGPEGSRKLR